MNRFEDIHLDGAFKKTPETCREAVTRAVSSYKEEERMKRPLTLITAIALILVLLCGTAFALANYYSVRDSVAGGAPSQAFESNIIPLEKTQSSNGVTVSLGDAVFDGRVLNFTVELQHDADALPVFLYGELKADYNGEPLSVGSNSVFEGGVLYPSADPRYPVRERQNISAEIYEPTAGADWKEIDGSVHWAYDVKVLRPNWEILSQDSMGYEEYRAACADAYAEQKILAAYGQHLEEYADAIPEARESGETMWVLRQLIGSGAFSLADTMKFEFTTEAQKPVNQAGVNVFHFDGFEVEVKRVFLSFMRVNYELELRFDQYQPKEYDMDCFYDLFDPAGIELAFKDGTLHLNDDHRSATLWGSVEYISDQPLASVTFKPSARFNVDTERAEDTVLWFTVSLQ